MMSNNSRSMMKLRATISRKDRLEVVNGVMNGSQDRYGHGTATPGHGDGWSQIYASLPCWVFHQNGLRKISDKRTISTERSVIAVPLGTDLQEGDRVDQVCDRMGTILYGAPSPDMSDSPPAGGSQLQVTHVTHKIRYIDAELLEVDRGAN